VNTTIPKSEIKSATTLFVGLVLPRGIAMTFPRCVRMQTSSSSGYRPSPQKSCVKNVMVLSIIDVDRRTRKKGGLSMGLC